MLASPSVADLAVLAAEHRADDRVWVTAMPPPAEVPSGLDVLAHAEALMSRPLDDVGAPFRPGLVAEHLHDDPSVVHVSYRVDDEQAARGVVSVIGEVAVFDKILTEDAFRRQGLGRDVMTALTLEALSRGATRALLVASPEGQALYGALGWSTVQPVHTFAPN